MIRMLFDHPEFCCRLGHKAAETALAYTWERNGRELTAIFEEILRQKVAGRGCPAPMTPKPAGLPRKK